MDFELGTKLGKMGTGGLLVGWCRRPPAKAGEIITPI